MTKTSMLGRLSSLPSFLPLASVVTGLALSAQTSPPPSTTAGTIAGMIADTATVITADTNAGAIITAEDVMRHIGVIAADSMRGRNTPSPGSEQTARYVAAQFQQLGLTPGSRHGSWFQRYPIPGKPQQSAPNVVGMLQGSDPALRHEYLVVCAHMDGAGAGRDHGPGNDFTAKDSIYNGASDNAVGVAGLFAVARAFHQPGMQPRRSVIFLAVSGMKHGLWGSDYFVTHPVVSLRQVVAALNLDAVGTGYETNGRYGVNVPGIGYSSLGVTFNHMRDVHPELKIDTAHVYSDDVFFDSDQFMFAQHGIPSLSVEKEDGNFIGDAPDQVDAHRVARVLRLVFYVSRTVTDAPERPQWNKAWYAQITEHP